MSPPARASLLGLPPELRLLIYAFLMHNQLDRRIDADLNAGVWRRGYSQHPATEPLPGETHYITAYHNLLLSHPTFMKELSEGCTDDRKYVLEITAARLVECLRWQRIPCSPDRAKKVEVTIYLPHQPQFWGDGGPQPVVSQLYQTLNRLLHCGPSFAENIPLSEHMHIEDLVVHVQFLAPVEAEREVAQVEEFFRNHAKSQMRYFVSAIEAIGVLYGYVDRLQLDFEGDTELLVMPVKQREVKVPEEWKGYGFDWGVLGMG